jgi:arsenite methyltransferase
MANSRVLDIGCGTGFPLLELAQRIDRSCSIYGLDPWTRALKRTSFKAGVYEITNIALIEAVAEDMPFASESFHTLVSNNGINNVSDQRKVIAECRRVSKREAQLVMTMNCPKTMKEFYDVFASTLRELKRFTEIERMKQHVESKRPTVQAMCAMLEQGGFLVKDTIEDSFSMRYAGGTPLFNHYFIRQYFLKPWEEIVDTQQRADFFSLLERRLNERAERHGDISLTIPFACIDCRRE